LREVQEALDVRRDKRFDVLDRVIRKWLREEDSGVVDSMSIALKRANAVPTISAAVAGSPT